MFRKALKIFLITGLSILSILSFILAQEHGINPLIYENKELGVKITGPEGWFVDSDVPGFLVVFSPSPFTSSSECFISLATGPLTPTKFKTALEVASAQISSLATFFKDYKIVEEPTIITQGNREGVNFVYEGGKDITVEDYEGHLENRTKTSVYIFIKDNIAYFLYCSDTAANFDNNSEIFETTVNSFVLK